MFSLHLQFGKDDDGVETTTSFEEEDTTTTPEDYEDITTTTEAGPDFFDPVPAEDPTECELNFASFRGENDTRGIMELRAS